MPPNKPASSKEIIIALEQERNRISSELHDDVNQLILTAKLHVEMARKGSNDISLTKAEDCLVRAIEAVKKITHGLVPGIENLEKSITGIVESLTLLNIEVKVDLDLALLKKLSPEQQLMIYRIIQEQTSNILKYASASSVSISIRDGSMAELTITDNGVGFNKEKIKPGIGFINMLNRATALNGNLEIISSPGSGCTLKLSFPI